MIKSKQHVMCECGHGALIHFGKCAVKGCKCKEFKPDPTNVYEQEITDGAEQSDERSI